MADPPAPLLRALLAGLLLAFVLGVGASLPTESGSDWAASDVVLRRPVRDAPVAPTLELAGPAAAVEPGSHLFQQSVSAPAMPSRQSSAPPSRPPRPAVLPRAPPRS